MKTWNRLLDDSPSPFKVDYKSEQAIEQLGQHLAARFRSTPADQDVVILCIGTDRSTGDSLGPLVGTKLHARYSRQYHVYGTLEHPVHAMNLAEKLDEIQHTHHNPLMIAIDACLGQFSSVGSINVIDGPLKPGAGVKKELPAVGTFHITGIVNVGGFMEYFVLQNTRLYIVMQMAEIIAAGIHHGAHALAHHSSLAMDR
ncbi:spore protease YyaC [Brevibacillus migulae]|uniref:spore protease YyaC n=1 Tax=Brevibacillus migulae TaxID=1644114 RepID=UPI00106E2525|nr:spore protease YyaC [Brevibacillus migulae]